MSKYFKLFCSRLAQGVKANKKSIEVYDSNLNYLFAKKLMQEGFISSVAPSIKKNTFLVKLKYNSFGYPALNKLRTFPTGRKQLNFNYKMICRLVSPVDGVFFFHTSVGLLTDVECVKRKRGGILFCYVK